MSDSYISINHPYDNIPSLPWDQCRYESNKFLASFSSAFSMSDMSLIGSPLSSSMLCVNNIVFKSGIIFESVRFFLPWECSKIFCELWTKLVSKAATLLPGLVMHFLVWHYYLGVKPTNNQPVLISSLYCGCLQCSCCEIKPSWFYIFKGTLK